MMDRWDRHLNGRNGDVSSARHRPSASLATTMSIRNNTVLRSNGSLTKLESGGTLWVT